MNRTVVRWSFVCAGVAVIGCGTQNAQEAPTSAQDTGLSLTIQAATAEAHEELTEILQKRDIYLAPSSLIRDNQMPSRNPNGFSGMIVEPNSLFDHKIQVVEPDANVDYKILEALGTRTGSALDVRVLDPETGLVLKEETQRVQKHLKTLAAERLRGIIQEAAADSAATQR